MSGKALMTQYIEGCLVSRELNDMMVEYAAQARFDREMVDDIDLYVDREHPVKRGLTKEGLEP